MSLMEKIGLWEKTSSVTNGNSALAFLSFERSVPQLQFSGYWCMDAGRENLLKGSQSTRICCLAPIIPASREFYPEVTKPPLVDFRPTVNSIPPQRQKAGLNAQNVIEDSGRQLLAPSFTSCLSKHLPFLVIFHKHVLSDYCVLVTWSHVLSYPLILILLDPEVQTWT